MRTRSSLALKLPMRQEFTASLAIKSANGMGFGTAYWMQGDRMAFTTEMELEKDDRIEVRMELTGFNDSALGEILVIQTRLEDSGMLTCLGQIIDMPKEDFEMLNQWLDDLIAGNTASQSTRWLRSITNSRGPQADEDETLAALARMDRKMGRDSKTPSTTPAAVASKSGPDSSIRRKIGRQAIRAALRASVQAGPPVEPAAATEPATTTPPLKVVESIPAPTVAIPTVAIPTIPVAPTLPVPTIETAPTPIAIAEIDNTLQVGIRVVRTPAGTVQLSWANTQSLIHTWNQGLKRGQLALPPFANAPAAGEKVRFDFKLPDGETFALRGSVTQSDAAGLQCTIRIPWGTRIKLLRIQEKA